MIISKKILHSIMMFTEELRYCHIICTFFNIKDRFRLHW